MAPSPHTHARGFWSRLVLNNARFIAGELRKIAAQLEAAAPGPPAVALILFHTPQGEIAMSDITVQDDSAPVAGTLKLYDAKGNETPADDVPRWTSSDESIATVAPSADGLTVEVTVVGKTGAALITGFTTEADSGAEIQVIGTVTVVPDSTAVRGEVAFAPTA